MTGNGETSHHDPRCFSIVTIGVDLASSKAADLTKFSLDEQAARIALRRLHERFAEVLVLATCHRTELTVLTAHPDRAGPAAAEIAFPTIAQSGRLPAEFVVRRDRAAVAHLFGVTAGLESILVGEREIFAQARQAIRRARNEQTIGPIFDQLLRMTVATGRRVRRETTIERKTASIGHSVVTLAQNEFGSLQGLRLVVIGSGQAAKSVLHAFQNYPLGSRIVANRTESRAESVAQNFASEAVDIQQAGDALARSDLVVLATADPERLSLLPKPRNGSSRPLVFDLGPSSQRSDIDARSSYYSIEDIYNIAAARNTASAATTTEAIAIIDEEVSHFFNWWSRRDLIPVVTALVKQSDRIAAQSLAEALKRAGPLTPRQHAAMEHLATAVARRLTHAPLERLSTSGSTRNLTRAAIEMFGLQTSEDTEDGKDQPEPEIRQNDSVRADASLG